MNLKRMNIGQRLGLGFGVVIVLLMMLAGLSYVRIGSLNSEINLLIKDRYPKTVAATQIKDDLNEIVRSMLNVLVMNDAGQIQKELANIPERNKSTNDALASLHKTSPNSGTSSFPIRKNSSHSLTRIEKMKHW